MDMLSIGGVSLVTRKKRSSKRNYGSYDVIIIALHRPQACDSVVVSVVAVEPNV